MYFSMFLLFMVLVIAPAVGGPKLNLDLASSLGDNEMIQGLFQPNPTDLSLYHNDTGPINTAILQSESSVLAAYESTRTDQGTKATGTAAEADEAEETGSADSEDTSSSDATEDVGGSDEDGFSNAGRLVKLL